MQELNVSTRARRLSVLRGRADGPGPLTRGRLRLISCLLVDLNLSWEQRRNSLTKCNRVQESATREYRKTRTESQAGVGVAQGDFVGLVALPCVAPSAGVAPRARNRDDGAVSRFLASSRAGDMTLKDRPKPCLALHLWRVADSSSGAARTPGLRRGNCGPNWDAHGGGLGCACTPRLTNWSERARSRSPCGVRARDECTKRSGRSFWTGEHFVRSDHRRCRPLASDCGVWMRGFIISCLPQVNRPASPDGWPCLSHSFVSRRTHTP